MSAWTWRFIPDEPDPGENRTSSCEAQLLCDGMVVDRESFDDMKAANKWARQRLGELGVL
jgi:hypothetical protein